MAFSKSKSPVLWSPNLIECASAIYKGTLIEQLVMFSNKSYFKRASFGFMSFAIITDAVRVVWYTSKSLKVRTGFLIEKFLIILFLKYFLLLFLLLFRL